MRALELLCVVVAAAAAGTTLAQQSRPTPGPAAKAGKAIDRALAEVSHDVGEALTMAKVRIALLEHLRSDGLGIHIDVRGKEVVLTGSVRQRSSVDLAEQAAASVDGVASVKNRIELEVEAGAADGKVSQVVRRAESEVADALLEAHVKARLISELGKVAFDIEVEATDGVVSLSGTVPDTFRRDLARTTARATNGVRELHDFLRVSEH